MLVGEPSFIYVFWYLYVKGQQLYLPSFGVQTLDTTTFFTYNNNKVCNG